MFRQITNYFAKKDLTKVLFNFLDIDTVFLNYHRVISDEEYSKNNRPDDDLIVSKSVFEKQIKYLKQNFNVISINDINKNFNLKKKIVITFDDGYFDNFENAFPILQKYNCPAIIYIVTSFLDNKNYPWWLKIWRIIEANEHIFYDQKKIDITNKSSKINTYNFFCEKIAMMKNSEQNSFFNIINKDLNNNRIDKINEFLSTDDIINLSKSEFIEIGCHTHYHQNLKILSDEELYDEISKSKLILEQTLDKEINHFSIPFGTTDRFSERSLELLKKFNFKTIVTTENGNFRNNKILRIPRIGIGNNDLNDTLYSKALGFDSFINKILNR